jgi:hypothetical protein
MHSVQEAVVNGPPDYNAGPNHVFNATEQIVNLPQIQESDLAQPLHLPKDQIDHLLTSSLQLTLAEEVTPVQIWSRISQLSCQFPIGPGILQALKLEALKYSRCNRSVTLPSNSSMALINGAASELSLKNGRPARSLPTSSRVYKLSGLEMDSFSQSRETSTKVEQ